MRFESKVPGKYIDIKKDNVPYTFTLDNRFFLEVRYNNFEDRYRFILYDKNYDENEGKGRVLGDGEEKAVLDFPLFFPFNSDSENKRNPEFPLYDLVPRSTDRGSREVNYNNLGETVFIELVGDV